MTWFALPILCVCGFVRGDHRVILVTNREQLVFGHDVFARRFHMVLVDARFDDGVDRARFFAKTAIDAFEKIDDILSRGKLPIVVGGTGLYLNALMYEMDFSEAVGDPEFREEMRKQAMEKGSEYIHDLLKEVDHEAAERIHHNNMKRVIRALEICRLTGGTSKDFANDPVLNEKYDFIFSALTGNRKKLYARINKRVDIMLENGLLDEVKKLKNMGLTDCHQSMKGIGYKEVLAYLDDRYDYDTMISIIKQSSRRYAKRQLTWLRRYENLKWFDIDKLGGLEALLDQIDNYIKEKKA